MTPKQKAKRLVNKFYIPIAKRNYPDVAQMGVAIECALIALEEIFITYMGEFDSGNLTIKEYYLQTRDEILNFNAGTGETEQQ